MLMKHDTVLIYPDKALKQIARPVKILTKSKVKRILNMFDIMYNNGGIGLAAPQIGWGSRIFIVGLKALKKTHEFVFINPEIIEYSSETCVIEEGCLSLPDVTVAVERPKDIVIRATDLDGSTLTMETSNMLSRCIQHEYDHLSGILLIDKIGNDNQIS